MRIAVSTKDGVEWSVHRRWLPMRPAHRDTATDYFETEISDPALPSVLVTGLWIAFIVGTVGVIWYTREPFILSWIVVFLLAGRHLGVARWPLDVRRKEIVAQTIYIRGNRASRAVAAHLAIEISQRTDAELLDRRTGAKHTLSAGIRGRVSRERSRRAPRRVHRA